MRAAGKPTFTTFQWVLDAVHATVESNRMYSSCSEDCPMNNLMRDFECVSEPPISIKDFVTVVGTVVAADEWVIAVMLVDRLLKKVGQPLGVCNAHRLLLVAGMISLKLRRDASLVNGHIARLCGVSTGELMKMECSFLSLLDWDITIRKDEVMYVRAILPSLGKANQTGRNLLPSIQSH